MEKNISEQVKLVEERMSYHFGNRENGFTIPKQLPFMLEFLGEVDTLCKLLKK